MAVKTNKINENVPGQYYVDSSCIGCGLCADSASGNFKMNGSGDLAIVFKQPENSDEQTACEDALGSCPADAIGNDGA